jgi:hypothetical protein
MNSPNPLSGLDPKHGRAVDADIDEQALVASGPQPKHGLATALSADAAEEHLDLTSQPSPMLHQKESTYEWSSS